MNTIIRGVPVTEELYHRILFCVHSFVRPTVSELYALKHSDVGFSEDPKGLLLTIRKGKTGHRVSATMDAAISSRPLPAAIKQVSGRSPDLSAPREASRSSAFDAAVEFLQLLGEASKESLVVSELAGVERLHALDLGQRVHGLVHNADFVDRVAQRGGVLLSSQYVLEALQRSIRRRRDGEVHRAERSPAELGTTAVRKKNPPGEEGAEALEVDPSDLP